MSPSKWSFFELICKNPRQSKNKILTIFECSNSKPYCQDSSKKWYFSRFRSFTDFACGAYGIVPEEYSMMYPVREDGWAHADESESVAFKYNLVSCNRGYEYIKAMGYEKVIVIFQNHAPEEFLVWMKNMPGMKEKMIFVHTDELEEKCNRAYPQFGKGLLVTRFMNLPQVHEAYIKALKSCLDGDDRKRLSELEKLVKNDDKTGQKHWIEETNEKFGITPYETDTTSWPVKLPKSERRVHTRTSDINKGKVSEYEKWLVDFAKKRNKIEVDKDTKLYDEKLIFTPLDLLIMKDNLGEDNPKKLDVDDDYWNFMKAIENVADEIGVAQVDPDKYHRYDYLWCFKSVLKVYKKDDLKKYCDNVGVSQFEQNVLDR